MSNLKTETTIQDTDSRQIISTSNDEDDDDDDDDKGSYHFNCPKCQVLYRVRLINKTGNLDISLDDRSEDSKRINEVQDSNIKLLKRYFILGTRKTTNSGKT